MAEQHEQILLEILTPEETLLVEPATLVVVPSQEGDLGVFAQSAPVVCALRAGVVCIFDANLAPKTRYFVPGGMAWITQDRVSLLVTEAIDLERLDVHSARQELLACESLSGSAHDETKIAILQQRQYALENLPYA